MKNILGNPDTHRLTQWASYINRHLRKQFCTRSLVQSRQFIISTTLYDHPSLHRKQAGKGGVYSEGHALQKMIQRQESVVPT